MIQSPSVITMWNKAEQQLAEAEATKFVDNMQRSVALAVKFGGTLRPGESVRGKIGAVHAFFERGFDGKVDVLTAPTPNELESQLKYREDQTWLKRTYRDTYGREY